MMKIPKYVEQMITRRQRLAEDLMSVDERLSKWLDKQGLDTDGELADCTYGGVMMYSEPWGAAETVREAIRKA